MCITAKKQLVAKFRECCAIISNIAKNGTPNHIIVNYILDYQLDEFRCYTNEAIKVMRNRGYKISSISIKNFKENVIKAEKYFGDKQTVELYEDIHNGRYLKQCFMNLQEK